MLDLLMPFQGVADGRGVQHVVDLDHTTGPPWSALCGFQLQVSRVTFAGRLDDARPRCAACEREYRTALFPSKFSRPAPPRVDAPRATD